MYDRTYTIIGHSYNVVKRRYTLNKDTDTHFIHVSRRRRVFISRINNTINYPSESTSRARKQPSSTDSEIASGVPKYPKYQTPELRGIYVAGYRVPSLANDNRYFAIFYSRARGYSNVCRAIKLDNLDGYWISRSRGFTIIVYLTGLLLSNSRHDNAREIGTSFRDRCSRRGTSITPPSPLSVWHPEIAGEARE